MNRAVAAFFSTLLVVTFSAAQNISASADSNTSNRTTTIRGCLSGSALNNAYTITQDQTGSVFTLTGNTGALSSNVVKEVEVTGTEISSSAASDQSAAVDNSGSKNNSRNDSTSTGTTGNTGFDVKEVHPLDNSCSGTGTKPTHSPGAMGRNLTRSADVRTKSINANSNLLAQNEDIKNNLYFANPQQNSPELPLLGLVGLGSLVAGLIMRR
jgi:hypothetical protein